MPGGGATVIGPIMKRKISAIMAADIAGYSRLVAEDEEETLRRLESYRSVFQDFTTRFAGRIFNTAGDAILSEFPSSVDAVRCAIDLQESLRTRNLAYPASRHMSFRIGVTIGDVVERDGDLLGDGVNIAARLAGFAEPGGICISRAVHEQVANKLSVTFVDIGEQEVKNIPTPIHAYLLALGGAAARPVAPAPAAVPQRQRGSALRPTAIATAAVAVAAVAAFLFFTLAQGPGGPAQAPAAGGDTATEQPAPPGPRRVEELVPETIPFIPDRQRANIRIAYLPAPDHKALAISNLLGAFISNQKDDETAIAEAMARCQSATPARKCELYAVGDQVVWQHGRPPMPPEPWVTRDPSIETPFAIDAIPIITDQARSNLERNYKNARTPKAAAISSQGTQNTSVNQSSIDEAVRRALETCGSFAGAPCMIVAIDNVFVVPIPTYAKATGLFRAAGSIALAPDMREDVTRQLANARSGWNAVAAGANGRPGLMLKAVSEHDAVEGALKDCGRKDRACRVIAIGPFAVEPK
jgi:class 3 adenylate cyclase